MTETETLQLKLKLAELENENLRLKLQLGNPTATTVSPAPLKAKKERKAKAPKAPKPPKEKKEKAVIVLPEVLTPLPDCMNTRIENGTVTPLFRVYYKSGKGIVGIWGVTEDELVTFRKGEPDEETKRMLKLRPLEPDYNELILMNRFNFNFTKGFSVAAHGPQKSGGEVLGIVTDLPVVSAAPANDAAPVATEKPLEDIPF